MPVRVLTCIYTTYSNFVTICSLPAILLDASKWKEHRSSKRYFKAVMSSLDSGVLRGLTLEVGVMIFIACGVCVYNHVGAGDFGQFWGLGNPDSYIGHHRAQLDPLLLQLTSPALGLLLVFRTNSAYARWWEARTLLGSVVNKSRDMVRHSLIWFDRTGGDAATEEYIREICAYSVTLKHHLRLPLGGNNKAAAKRHKAAAKAALLDDLTALGLPPASISSIARAKHSPLEVIRRLSRASRNNAVQIISAQMGSSNSNNISRSMHSFCGAGDQVQDSVVRALDKNIAEMVDQIGACERILKTPMPLVYTRHTERFLGLWLACMPFALADKFTEGSSGNDVAIILGSAFISFFFLGIDELGVQIEEPFSVLPMDNLCDVIQSSAFSMLDCERGLNEEEEEEEEEEECSVLGNCYI